MNMMNTVSRLLTPVSCLLIAASCLLTSCDNIDRDNRLIYEKPAAAKRTVLLEDFTGQRCINCPKGTEVIEQLVGEYGDAVVAVGIHGGPLGFKGNAANVGLATETGDEYYSHWKLEYQPVGMVDRHNPVNYPEWAATVREELSKPATLDLNAQADIDSDNNIRIMVAAFGTDGTTTGKIQLWVLEDGITALQLMPDGSSNNEYVHNHVFRKAVNGIWGDDFTVSEGESKVLDFTQALDAAWNADRLSIVAFVYNDNGVQQVVKAKVGY